MIGGGPISPKIYQSHHDCEVHDGNIMTGRFSEKLDLHQS